ncbi:N-acetylmuramoyl-L-alanine amidase [Streptomyces enissocaesilis]|uniref:N-acetylmuramoyl-L-alanine amidase n=1 Tax=Streptomyces enissocaesilis TaxID=332589 RepID=A0ABN3WNE6_9ACTN
MLLAASSLAVGPLALAGPAAFATPPVPVTTAETAEPSGVLHTLAVPAGGDPAVRALPRHTTPPFSLVGLTWDDPYAELGGTAEVRTRDSRTGAWSGWRALDTDARTPESGPEHAGPGLRAGTQPLWTGPSDGVQLRVSAKRGLPDGLRVDLVDPGDTEAPVPRTATVAPTAPGQPTITSRAGWGADESLVANPPTYTGDTEAVFVHHTAGSNDYTCAESASVIRGLFVYHVKSQGWNDIGYHFLVDKCGTLFEGRAGGVDKPVQGAHTYGFNTGTSSVSVLGDYNTATTTPVVRESVAKVAAWKLGLYGHDPSGTVTLTAGADNGKYKLGQKVVMNRISGHRDGYPTECPGSNLYADLPAIRTAATATTSPSGPSAPSTPPAPPAPPDTGETPAP